MLGGNRINHIIEAYKTEKINLAPETVVAEILQNIRVLISTPRFTVPLDRAFGLSISFLDKPLPVAQAIIITELLDAIEKYEPRVEVVEVTFGQDETMPGKLIPRVEVKIIDHK